MPRRGAACLDAERMRVCCLLASLSAVLRMSFAQPFSTSRTTHLCDETRGFQYYIAYVESGMGRGEVRRGMAHALETCVFSCSGPSSFLWFVDVSALSPTHERCYWLPPDRYRSSFTSFTGEACHGRGCLRLAHRIAAEAARLLRGAYACRGSRNMPLLVAAEHRTRGAHMLGAVILPLLRSHLLSPCTMRMRWWMRRARGRLVPRTLLSRATYFHVAVRWG
ncbi:hypothetical protein B0H14DRAFT_222382 [Mycena olivaceomarginata]|nr:hypothetical protein B0H14DRAFT_222382 [Mycena olivaceomarginata]